MGDTWGGASIDAVKPRQRHLFTTKILFLKKQEIMETIVNTLVLVLCVSMAQCYSGGAPKGVCNSMNPGHGIGEQSGKIPYSITARQSGNNLWEIKLEGRDSLKGFIIRGFKSNGSPGGRFVNMNSNNDARIMPCSGQSSVTHANSVSKSSVKLQWSPDCTGCQFYFDYTVAKDYSTYWVKRRSSTITV